MPSLVDEAKITDYTKRVDDSELSNEDKSTLKNRAIEAFNNAATRAQQTVENNPITTQPRIIVDNSMPQASVINQPKIIASNEMPHSTQAEVNAALATPEAIDIIGDQGFNINISSSITTKKADIERIS